MSLSLEFQLAKHKEISIQTIFKWKNLPKEYLTFETVNCVPIKRITVNRTSNIGFCYSEIQFTI